MRLSFIGGISFCFFFTATTVSSNGKGIVLISGGTLWFEKLMNFLYVLHVATDFNMYA